MRILFYSVCICLTLMTFGGNVNAQSSPDNHLAITNKPWTIGNMKRDNGTVSDTCIMTNTYDNGIEVTLKGNGGRLTALRVQSRGGKFAKELKGFIGLGFGKNSYGLQSRSLNGQIDASLISVVNAQKRFLSNPMYRLRIGMKDYYFSTRGFKDGYRKLLECQGNFDMSVETLKVVSDQSQLLTKDQAKKNRIKSDIPLMSVETVKAEPVILTDAEIELKIPNDQGTQVELARALPMIVPSDYTYVLDEGVSPTVKITWLNDKLWMHVLQEAIDYVRIATSNAKRNLNKDTKPLTPIKTIPPIAMEDKEIESMDVSQDQDNAISPQVDDKKETDSFKWIAKEGERIEDVLNLWAQIANVKTNIDLRANPVVTKNYDYTGTFADAVQGLLATTTGIDASLADGDVDTALTHAPKAKSAMQHMQSNDLPVQKVEAIKMAEPKTVRWRALEGTNLENTLNRWSQKEQIELIWDIDQVFLIPETLDVDGTYEQAVTEILDQFKKHPVRPVAQLNKDPKTGRSYLIIKKI